MDSMGDRERKRSRETMRQAAQIWDPDEKVNLMVLGSNWPLTGVISGGSLLHLHALVIRIMYPMRHL